MARHRTHHVALLIAIVSGCLFLCIAYRQNISNWVGLDGHDWESSLREAVAGADRLVIVPVDQSDGAAAIAIRDPARIRQWLGILSIDPSESGLSCKCSGEHALCFFQGDQLLATVGFAHGDRLKWQGGLWKGDAVLTGESAGNMANWFHLQGCNGSEEPRPVEMIHD